MRRILACAALVLALTPRASQAGLLDPKGKPIDDFFIEVEGRYWFGKLSGDIEADAGSIDGTGIDLAKDLDIDKPVKPMIEGAARLRLKKILVRGSYFQTGFSEKTRLDETIKFEDLKVTAGREIKARAHFDFIGLDATALLVDSGSAAKFGLRVGAGIGARYLHFKSAITDTATGLSARATGGGIVPVIAVNASLGLFNLLSINVDAAAMKVPKVDYLKFEGTLVDASAEVRVYLHHFVYVHGGYRFLMLKASFHDKDVELSSKLTGLYFGIGVSF